MMKYKITTRKPLTRKKEKNNANLGTNQVSESAVQQKVGRPKGASANSVS